MRKILLVEDDPSIRQLVRLTIEELADEIVEASSLRAAREALLAFDPDIVLLDLLLPDGEGASLLADIPHAVPIIAMTGSERLIAQPGRVVSFLPKPFDPENLDWLVRSAFKRSDAIAHGRDA